MAGGKAGKDSGKSKQKAVSRYMQLLLSFAIYWYNFMKFVIAGFVFTSFRPQEYVLFFTRFRPFVMVLQKIPKMFQNLAKILSKDAAEKFAIVLKKCDCFANRFQMVSTWFRPVFRLGHANTRYHTKFDQMISIKVPWGRFLMDFYMDVYKHQIYWL